MIWEDIALGIAGNIVTDILKRVGGDRFREYQDNKKNRPKIMIQVAQDNRKGANFRELNRANRALLHYYVYNKIYDDGVRSARYSLSNGIDLDLPIIAKSDWISAIKARFPIVSHYIKPRDRDIPTIPLTRHRPWRLEFPNPNLKDGHPYMIRNLRIRDKRILVDFSNIRFFDWLDSYGNLEQEFNLQIPALYLESHLGNPLKGISFRLRDILLPNVESIVNYKSRVNAGGVTVLCVVPIGNNDAKIFVEERSAAVSDNNKLLTTIPRGFHDSLVNVEDDYTLEVTVVREVIEELFAGKSERQGEPDTEAYIESCPAVREAIENESYSLIPTGLFSDLIKGNYTFTYLLVVKDKTWYSRHHSSIRLNDEFLNDTNSQNLLNLANTEAISEMIRRPDWSSEGYYAFIEGLRILPDIFNEENLGKALIKRATEAASILPILHWVKLSEFNSIAE